MNKKVLFLTLTLIIFSSYKLKAAIKEKDIPLLNVSKKTINYKVESEVTTEGENLEHGDTASVGVSYGLEGIHIVLSWEEHGRKVYAGLFDCGPGELISIRIREDGKFTIWTEPRSGVLAGGLVDKLSRRKHNRQAKFVKYSTIKVTKEQIEAMEKIIKKPFF